MTKYNEITISYDRDSAHDCKTADLGLLGCVLHIENTVAQVYMNKTTLTELFNKGVPILNRKGKQYKTLEEIFTRKTKIPIEITYP